MAASRRKGNTADRLMLKSMNLEKASSNLRTLKSPTIQSSAVVSVCSKWTLSIEECFVLSTLGVVGQFCAKTPVNNYRTSAMERHGGGNECRHKPYRGKLKTSQCGSVEGHMDNSSVDRLQFIYVSQIPTTYHACHLRNFFSQYVESSSFTCFHFRHRPQIIEPSEDCVVSSIGLIKHLRDKTRRDNCQFCALLALPERLSDEFIRRYDKTHWLSTDVKENETPLEECCRLQIIQWDNHATEVATLQALLEFKPPGWMPRGNVGTPTSHFFNLIKNCQLDSSIISKLRLNFSPADRRRRYGAVPYNYSEPNQMGLLSFHDILPAEVRSGHGTRIVDDADYSDFTETRKLTPEVSFTFQSSDEECLPEQEPDEPCEEWERFEALHDDPYKLERRDKANLKYEDKIELVWEKGGPGLVFHTDERTWRKMDPLRKEEFFDEPGSFDWDIDMHPYEDETELSVGPTPTGHWGSARDTTDLIHMQRTEESIDLPHPSLDKSTLFRRETKEKGFGFGLMRKMGWKPGMRLGRHAVKGLLVPVDSDDGLPPRVRTGLGYYGPRLERRRPSDDMHTKPVCSSRTVYIRSVFDSPSYVRSRSQLGHTPSLLRRNDPVDEIKYRSDFCARSSLRSSSEGKSINSSDHATVTTTKQRTVILSPYANVSKEGISFVPGGLLR
ncbi:G patch domain-containing protein 3 [Clonorchis sinensis]|uniref:G patch domain-containing protein 3 n=1 Tax=Clonorchis sinensis TaxID=79923 RepID=H2KTL8_CLOSI|nr:G patch domain-containing protein 3 [Clonorchis sinensis]